MPRTLSFLFFMIIFQYLPAQETVGAFRWSSKKLEWSDFQEDNSTVRYGNTLARTYWKINVGEIDTTAHALKGGMTVNVVAYFIPSRSYVRRDIKGSKSVLAHEQLHFDIAEVFARRLRKELSQTRVTPKNYERVVGKIKRRMFSAAQKMQEDYDETHKQRWQEWVDKVNTWLDELKDYQSDEVFIPLANE
jgi:hypothetical protein